jgi:serine/threonine protein phosphatase 1
MSRIIAMGDIHGCSGALDRLLSQLDPRRHDTIVTLGDYVDRGWDSKGVLDRLIALSNECRLIPILGNHDEMMLRARDSQTDFDAWVAMGGIRALQSYGEGATIDLVPDEHFAFLKSCRPYYETDTHAFLHANYLEEVPFAALDAAILRWRSLRDYVPTKPHCSGKIVVVGHTPQPQILNLGYLICLDTGCATGGRLTALDVTTGQTWSAAEWQA